MKKKILWVLASAVIIAAMLLTACTKTPETTKTTTTAATTTAATTTAATTTAATTAVAEKEFVWTEKGGWVRSGLESQVTEVAKGVWILPDGVEEPRYGGTMTFSRTEEGSSTMDPWATDPHRITNMVYDKLMIASIQATEEDWPSYGGGGYMCPKEHMVGALAESWEEVDVFTLIFHLRQGVHFQNLPPVNGREMTSDDVVFSFNRQIGPGSLVATSQNLKWLIKSVTALDKYTVELKIDPSYADGGWWQYIGNRNTAIYAKEVVELYKNSLSSAAFQIGTGPYITKDWVPGSSLTFVRNPNYWGKDPRYPENQLPYIDKMVSVVIADASTQLAALRTGKIDRLFVALDQEESLTKTSPQLRHRKMLPESTVYISPRNNVPPLNNRNVRWALNMAIDRQTIVDQYYGGNAYYYCGAVPPHWDCWIPLEGKWHDKYEMPELVREIIGYHPDKARQLLVEAGYPNGFNTEIQISSSNRTGIDIMQLIVTWWADIGVNCTIKVIDPAAWQSQRQLHTFPQMQYGGGGVPTPLTALSRMYQPLGKDWVFITYNNYCVEDPVYNEKYLACVAGFDKPQEEQDRLWYDLNLYFRTQNYSFDIPAAATHLYWQPWLKGHWGQGGFFYGSLADLYKYMWIDSNMKTFLKAK